MDNQAIIKRDLKRGIPYLFILLMVLFALAFQINHQFFLTGTDTFFHMAVTYDTYSQIRHWKFSYFLSMFGFNHSLRIVNAVYGPLGGYFSGLILLLAGSWTRWQITFLFIVLMITGISMYQLCRYWRVTHVLSVIISYLYMFSFPVMSLWFNSQYDGLGAAFMPWVVLLGSKVLDHKRFSLWKAALLLVILAEIHVFSFLLAGLVLIMCYVMSLFTGEDRLALFGRLFKLMILTLLLTANVWGVIWEVLGSNGKRIMPTYSVSNMFQNVWSCISYIPRAPVSQNLKLLGLSGTVLVILIMVLYGYRFDTLDRKLNFMMIALGIFFFWLSSRWFPWIAMQKQFPILDTDLQFPKRFLPVSLTALFLVLGVLISHLPKHYQYRKPFYIVAILILCCFVGHAWQNVQHQYQAEYNQYTSVKFYQGSQFHRVTNGGWLVKPTRHNVNSLLSSLNSPNRGHYFQLVTKTTPDYLPSNRQIKTDAQYHNAAGYYNYYQQVVMYHGPRLHYQPGHHQMIATFSSPNRKLLTLPLVKYTHTSVMLNGKSVHPQRTVVGAIQVKPRAGYNTVTMKYEPSGWYKFIIFISIIMWLMLTAYLIDMTVTRINHNK